MKKGDQVKSSVFLLVAFGLLTISCNDAGDSHRETNPITPVGRTMFFPGHVAIGFVDSTNYPFIFSFIKGLNLTPIEIYADSSFSMWVQVDSGSVAELLSRLQKDSAVAWADRRGFECGDPLKAYLLVHFRGTVKFAYGMALIESLHGSSWKSTIQSPRCALLGVEIGSEQVWRDSLKTFPFVRWAELDYIVHVVDR